MRTTLVLDDDLLAEAHPALVRILFLASMILPGPQILAYLALWIIMPKEGRT